MFRTIDLVLIAVMVSAAAFTYNTKHKTEGTLREIHALEKKIRFEEDTIDILNADWALLTQPNRMQALTEAYKDQLELQPVDAGQFADIEELPMRPAADAATGTLEANREAGADKTATGSVKP